MRKILFLDIDGVCNSAAFAEKTKHKGVLGIDPVPAKLVRDIQRVTGCEVVLSSTWRLSNSDRAMVREQVVDFIDVTPDLNPDLRGAEIQDWLDRNPDVDRYAILDDDNDMLANQLENFFQTTWEDGLTQEIAVKVAEHLNGV